MTDTGLAVDADFAETAEIDAGQSGTRPIPAQIGIVVALAAVIAVILALALVASRR